MRKAGFEFAADYGTGSGAVLGVTYEWVGFRAGKKTTVVLATLENGFELVGASHCVHESEYDHEIGLKVCLQDVEKEIMQYEAYREQLEMRALRLMEQNHPVQAARIKAGPCQDCPD